MNSFITPMDRTKSFLTTITKQAGRILLDAAQKQAVITEKEGLGNFVTETDVKIEQFLIHAISSEFPQDGILSEETHQDLEAAEQAEHLWIIDPLDGTSNFVYKRNFSAVSIAYARKGEVQMGCVYDPFSNELYIAEKGQGSYLNDVKQQLPERPASHRLIIGTDNSYKPGTVKKHLQLVGKIEPSPWISMRGSAALALCWIASGKMDVYLHTDLKPWDSAAGLLIAQEAGSIAVNLENNPIDWRSPEVLVGGSAVIQSVISQFHI